MQLKYLAQCRVHSKRFINNHYYTFFFFFFCSPFISSTDLFWVRNIRAGYYCGEFSRQEYWSELLFPPRDLPDQGSNLGLLRCRQIPYHLSHQGSPTEGPLVHKARCGPCLLTAQWRRETSIPRSHWGRSGHTGRRVEESRAFLWQHLQKPGVRTASLRKWHLR